jgi:hypothetical protein
MREIARHLKVEVSEITLSGSKIVHNSGAAYRLTRLRKIGGSKLVRELQSCCNRISFLLRVEPGAKVAEEIATFIEFCQQLLITWPEHEEKLPLSTPDRIRAIGTINDAAVRLEEVGISVFFGTQYEYEAKSDPELIFPATLTGTLPLRPFLVSSSRGLVVLFSEETSDTITKHTNPYFTEEDATARAIKKNIELGIHPDWFEPDDHPFLRASFVNQYRAAYHKAYPIQGPLALTYREED